jgi:hypothetical protein
VHSDKHGTKFAQGAEGKMDEGLLTYYYKEWDRFTTAMTFVNNIFQYLVLPSARFLFFFGTQLTQAESALDKTRS